MGVLGACPAIDMLAHRFAGLGPQYQEIVGGAKAPALEQAGATFPAILGQSWLHSPYFARDQREAARQRDILDGARNHVATGHLVGLQLAQPLRPQSRDIALQRSP